MARQKSTSLKAILPLIRTRLIAATGIPEHRILFLARDSTRKFQGDQDLLVRIGPPRPVAGFVGGAGRVANVLVRTLQVTARTRRTVDQSDRDDYLLTDESEGHLTLEESVVDALHTFHVENEQGDLLTPEPIHWSPSAEPVHDTPVAQAWMHTDLMFDLHYQLTHTTLA